MKRAYRKTHFAMWLILGPIMAATLLIALMYRPAEPVNDELPAILVEDAR